MALKGKRAVVVGGSSGIGLAAAKAIAEQGAAVIIAGRSERKLRAAQEQIKGNVESRVADFTLEEQVRGFFDPIGRFDHLVLTAGGTFVPGSFIEGDSASARATFDGKFWAQYNAAKYGARHINPGGSITFFSGIFSRRPGKGFSALAANNSAIEGLCRALAIELAPIRVNAIAPGLVRTPLYDGMPEAARGAMFENVANALPVARIGAPEDIAEAVIYLMLNGYTTGIVLDVDGGTRLV